MYGTIARMRVREGMIDELRQMSREFSDQIDGMAFEHIYRSDTDPNEYWLVVAFESKEAYRANAESPEQHQRYLRFREMLEIDPEWNDGEIIESTVFTGVQSADAVSS